MPVILKRALIVFLFLLMLTFFIVPERLFEFPSSSPILWLLVMFLYPVLSAYPQELLYRTFIFERYKKAITSPFRLGLFSTFSFMFLHIIYGNFLAPVLPLGGGILFTNTYKKTNSLMAVAIELAIYGCIVFTIGLGRFFYEMAHSNTLPK